MFLPPPPLNSKIEKKELSEKEKIILERLKLSTNVISTVLSQKDLRIELNNFILAKVKKTGNDEELTFKEIFSGKTINLEGVKSTFFNEFRDEFIKTILSKNYRHSDEFSKYNFENIEQIMRFFGQDKSFYQLQNNSANVKPYTYQSVYDELEFDPGFELYFPYSENFENQNYLGNPYYSLTYNPLTNDDENEGEIFDAVTGQYLHVSLIDDDFAYSTPTYIITIDDGLNYEDLTFNLNNFIKTPNYKINISDQSYNPITFQNTSTLTNGGNVCNTELRVKDDKWGLIQNGYGLFEGAIEFAVAVSNGVKEVSIPNQNPASNPILTLDASAFGYTKIKRKKVKQMRDNNDEFINIGLYVSKWCPGDADKMIFLYEYDKPWLLSENGKEFSEAITGTSSLIKDPVLRASVSLIPLAPVVKALLEGTAKSRIEHYSVINSNAVNNNQRLGTQGITPNLLNGFRPYGKSSVFVTLVMD
jgi:hypothetical protein